MLTGSTNEDKIWNYLKAKGLSDYAAAGLMGNLFAESALIPDNLENVAEQRLGFTDATYTAAVDNGSYINFSTDSAGYGLAQWTYSSRKRKLLSYARSKEKSIGDLETQLEFLIKELEEDFSSVLTALKAADSVRSASDVVLLKYERPAFSGADVQVIRASYGQKYYNRYAKKEDVMLNIIEYSYSSSIQLSAHFNIQEFRCKCGRGHSTKNSKKLIEFLEKLFVKLDCSKIIVNSGYRCEYWDCYVGGNGMGQHVIGTAADIVCYDKKGKIISSKLVCCAAQDVGFTGIANIDKTYTATHVDVRENGKWYGDESVPGGTARSVTSNFYTYYGISKASTETSSGGNNASLAPEPARSMDRSLAGRYRVNASALNLRRGAGTNKTILATLPNGTYMQCYGYYTTVSGVKWLLVQTTYNNKTYTGYVSSEYASRS